MSMGKPGKEARIEVGGKGRNSLYIGSIGYK
jgi:hypothetical protein